VNAYPALLADPVDIPLSGVSLRERFLEAMAHLASGVSVVTAADPGGVPVGATVTSAVSLSADPPIIGVSLTHSSRSLASIRAGQVFVVNVLRSDGRGIAQVFASAILDKFRNVEWEVTRQGVPWLCGACSYAAACHLVTEVPAGDHLLLLGHVEDIYQGRPCPPVSREDAHGDALIYWRRAYHELRRPATGEE
jgi:flavin reductase (DIM6/NTAB) family NADH-FMN oxidoreductase RutF